jgi:hypothetical protein
MGMFGQTGSAPDRLLHAVGTGLTFSGNGECGAVVGRGAHHRQSEGNIDAFIEGPEL